MPAIDPIVDGDTGFVGVNMRLDPGQLQPGYVASARNKRFVNGTAKTRPGIKKMAWTNKSEDTWDKSTGYNSGEVVTYSGVAALVSGVSEAAVDGGSGTLSLQYAAPPNLINGDFQANTGWVYGGGWARTEVTSGVWVAEHASGSGTENLYQDIDAIIGCKYTVTYTVSNWTAGSIQSLISESSRGALNAYTGSGAQTQTFTDIIISQGLNPERLYIQAQSGFLGRVDDITVTSAALPGEVDILGTFSQGAELYKAAGPGSNNSNETGASTNIVGPYFKSTADTNTNNPPVQSYSAASSGSLSSTAESTINSNWTNLGHRIYGYGTVYGAGIFRDPLSVEHLLVATSDGVYATKEGSPSVLLEPWATQSGAAPTGDVSFTQCFNVVVMFKGDDESPMSMSNLGEGFKSVSQVASDTDLDENDSDGTETIPNASTGLFFNNRLLIPYQKDMVAVSDCLNYTRYQPIMSNFRINQGSEDELVGLRRINNSTIACFKTNSVYIVSNIYGNLSDVVLDEVTREYGAVSDKSIIQVGADVLFLSSKRGVSSLTVAGNGKVSAVDQPVSEQIQPLIDRINWNYADKAVAAYHNNRYYLAVPLDDATYNNAILIYDLLNKAWAGYDDGEAIKVKEFVETKHQGKRRLFFLSTDGFINLYDDAITECGFVDELASSTVSTEDDFGKISIKDVKDELVTRGYSAGDVSPKKWRSAEVHLATNDPRFQIKTQYDGPEEDDQELTPAATFGTGDLEGYITAGGKTFSRSTYDRPFDRAPFVESITNDDFFSQYRQDYSVDPDTEIVLGGNGFDPDIHQKSVNRYRYRGNSRYVQLRIVNTQGRCEVIGTKVGAVPGQNLTTKLV
jgi:hypothetical protein